MAAVLLRELEFRLESRFLRPLNMAELVIVMSSCQDVDDVFDIRRAEF